MTHPADTKEQLMQTAIDLFASKGFKGTSIRELAKAMDMSISNIYHYFGSKEGLLLAILDRSSTVVLERLSDISELNLNLLERFKAILEVHIRMSEKFKNETKIFFLDEEHLSAQGLEINKRTQRGILDIYLKELAILQEAGYLRSRDLHVAAFNILGVINWKLRWYRWDGAMSQEEVTREMVDFIIHGILKTSVAEKADAQAPPQEA